MSVIASTGEDGVPVTCFVDEIPEWVEAALETRYANLHASLPFFRIYRSLSEVGCYLAGRREQPLEILLFRRKRWRIEVLNEMFDLAAGETKRFVEFVFASFSDVDLISFNAVKTAVDGSRYAVQQYHSKHTFVVSLPATPDDYLARIGKTTRANIRQQLNTVKRVFPSFTSTCLEREEIDDDTLRTIIGLSEQRIKARGVRFHHDIDRISALARKCGIVVVLRIEGRICAGSINYRVGSDFFGDVTCYDPAYQRYGLGKLCTFHTICESVKRGGRQFYLGGGEFEFKERMLGKRVDMDQLQVYRSHAKAWSHPGWVARSFAQGQLRRYRAMLHAHKSSFQSRFVLGALQAYRNRMAK